MENISIGTEFCYCSLICTSKRQPCLSWRQITRHFSQRGWPNSWPSDL